MHDDGRAFLDDMVGAASPSGFETAGQQVWVEYVEAFADEVHTDAYGNAVAVYDGGSSGIPSLYLGLPNRYMHTPAEVVDLADLDTAADLLVALADREAGRDGFAVDI